MARKVNIEPASPITLASFLQRAITEFLIRHPNYSSKQTLQAIRITETFYRAAHYGKGKAKIHSYHTDQYSDMIDSEEP